MTNSSVAGPVIDLPSRCAATGTLMPKDDALLLPLGVTVISHAVSTTVNPSFMRKPSPTVNFAGSPVVHHDLSLPVPLLYVPKAVAPPRFGRSYMTRWFPWDRFMGRKIWKSAEYVTMPLAFLGAFRMSTIAAFCGLKGS